MDAEYHAEVTREALGEHFGPGALLQIVGENLAQDSWLRQRTSRSPWHFDNNRIREGLVYVESELCRIVSLVDDPRGGEAQRAAFAHICHAVQDFYSHSNFVDLWLTQHRGPTAAAPDDIDGLDEDLLMHPALRTGRFVLWRDWVYHVPLIRRIARCFQIPADSHEAMHLDSPERGLGFAYALEAARQRTVYEYRRVVRSILAHGGREALDRFHNLV